MWSPRLSVDWLSVFTGALVGLIVALVFFFLAAYLSPWSTLKVMKEQQQEIRRLDDALTLLTDSEQQTSDRVKQAADDKRRVQQELANYQTVSFGNFLAALMTFEPLKSTSGAMLYSDDTIQFYYPATMGEVKQLQSESDAVVPTEDGDATNEADNENWYFFTKNSTSFIFAGDEATNAIVVSLKNAEDRADWSKDIGGNQSVLLWLNLDTDSEPPLSAIRLPTQSENEPYVYMIGPSFYGKSFSAAELHDFLQIAFWFERMPADEPATGSGEAVPESAPAE